MAKLSENEIEARLPDAKGWDRLGDMLVRTWQFSSARRALEFVNQAAVIAERLDHYPDVNWSFRDVRFELCTHKDGGLTPADFDLAAELNAIPADR